MSISIFEMFSIGVGPSSSHTVGPMRAGFQFVSKLEVTAVNRVQVELYGSLALTGKGHATDKAVLMGLEGELPESVEPLNITSRCETICKQQQLRLGGEQIIPFDADTDLIFHKDKTLPCHANGLTFTAYDTNQKVLLKEVYYSIGGGFIVTEAEYGDAQAQNQTSQPFPFENAKTLLGYCEKEHCSIADIMLENEKVWADETSIKQRLLAIAQTMRDCIHAGLNSKETILPGGLNVKRRAPLHYEKLIAKGKPTSYEMTDSMHWLNVFAIAVNEENAAGGRIVTAPTNGAAGILPAVMHYYESFYPDVSDDNIVEYLLTAGAIALLYKKGASISGAEVGCQGEVGVASSMAAGALTAVLGGTIAQVENAAEIAMEHHLGMTCDPIAGLVQVPCIERNAMGSVKAVNATRLALMEDGDHLVPLDKVIATMKRTGHDMMTIYKETSEGGLAVNMPEC